MIPDWDEAAKKSKEIITFKSLGAIWKTEKQGVPVQFYKLLFYSWVFW